LENPDHGTEFVGATINGQVPATDICTLQQGLFPWTRLLPSAKIADSLLGVGLSPPSCDSA